MDGCQQCLFNPCVTLGSSKLFNKGSTMCVWNSRGEGKHHLLLSPATGDFTLFHLPKKWMPRSSPYGGWRAFQMTGALGHKNNSHQMSSRNQVHEESHWKFVVLKFLQFLSLEDRGTPSVQLMQGLESLAAFSSSLQSNSFIWRTNSLWSTIWNNM